MSDGPVSRPPRAVNPNDRSRGGRPHDSRADAKRGVAEPPVSPEEIIPRLTTFLDLVSRELALAAKYEISTVSESDVDGGDTAFSRRDGNSARPERRSNQPASESKSLVVRFSGEDEEILLARNGELLLALEYLAHRWLHLPPALYDGVRFECGDFRATRLEELKLSARVAAQRVRETGQPFQFNPMSSRDRRIIHVELNGAPGVRTISEGSGDHRHLVIYPANKK
ncbi:MAG TPA: R3H domain-containing nucleic acid-binding protein [Candidatus Acidoferrum sp.]|nr:R3H domain-containing nucleic acid-binding protein [Candidatus Acidoferrum sp.]